jgi:transposase-like protein
VAEADDRKKLSGSWPRETRERAKELYLSGQTIEAISFDTTVPISTLNYWNSQDQWKVDRLIAENEIALRELDTEVAVSNEVRDNLISGLRLVSSAGEDALRDDKLRFRDKKQAADVMLEGLRGQLELETANQTMEFLREIAKIIREEVTDDETLRRLAVRLTELGRLFNNRVPA